MPENKTEEIIKALRCSGSPGGPESCDGCPYKFREQLPKELWGEHGGKYVEGCDTDKIVLDAADLLEKLVAESEALKAKFWPEYCQDMAEYSCPRVVQLQQEIDHLRESTKMLGKDTNAPTKWVSVDERLPKRFSQVLLFDAIDEDVFVGELDETDDWFIVGFEDEPFRITHWMPLPEPPSTEGVE